MKLPEPVAEVLDHHARNQNNEITADLPCGTRLFTEAQLREALASNEAAMRTVLELLGPQAPECCGCAAEWNEAIKLLEEQLK